MFIPRVRRKICLDRLKQILVKSPYRANFKSPLELMVDDLVWEEKMELIKKLDKTIELLEQINNITMNQMTVIISASDNGSEEMNSFLDEMHKIKDELINEVDRVEISFEEEYKSIRQSLTNKEIVSELKHKIEKVIKLKEAIMENEKNNMNLAKSKLAQKNKPIALPKSPQSVINTYKNNNYK